MRVFGLEIRRARREGDRTNERQVLPSTFTTFGSEIVGPTTWSWQQMVAAYTSWVYIAIDKIAKSVAMLPLQLFVYRSARSGKLLVGADVKRELKAMETRAERRRWMKANGVEREQVLEHPFLELMRRPNHLMPRYALWYDTMVKLELGGSVGWYLPAGALGQPGEVWVLPLTETATLRPLSDPKEIIRGYEYRDGNLQQEFTVDEVLWMRYPSPKSPLVGQSPLVAQTFPYNVDSYLDQYQYYALANRNHVGVNLTTEHELTPEQVAAIKDQMRSDYEGARKAGKPFVTHSGFKVGTPLTTDLRNILVNEADRGVRDKLLASHDVSAGSVGLIDDVNRATLDALRDMFFTDCVRPRTMLVEEYIEAFVLPRYDERLTCDFEIPQYSQRELDLQERGGNLSSGYTTINEEREKAGLEPVPWGDAPWLPFGLAQPSVEEPAGGTGPGGHVPDGTGPHGAGAGPGGGRGDGSGMEAEREEGEGKARRMKARLLTPEYWTAERKAAHWNEYVKEHARWEALLVRTARSVFKAQREVVLERLRDYEPRTKAALASMARVHRGAWIKARDATAPFNIDKREERTRTRQAFAPALRSLLNAFGQRRSQGLLGIAKSLQRKAEAAVGIGFDVADPRVERWLASRLERFSKEITDVTFDEVHDILRDGFESGMGSAELAEALRGKFADWDKYRAPLIARTETTAGSNFADLEAVHQAGLEGRVLKTWISSRDGATRDSHIEAELAYAEGIPVGADFEVGADSMQAPGGGLRAEENINCFPGDTFVYAPGAEALFHSHFDGEIVTIEMADGKQLSGTPNHPILTERGFVPLGFLVKGDRVIAAGESEWAGLGQLDKQHRPTQFEQAYDFAAHVGNVVTRLGGYGDFYGDGGNGNVDIVGLDGLLMNRMHPFGTKPREHLALAHTYSPRMALEGQRARNNDLALLTGAHGATVATRRCGESLALGGRCLTHAQEHSVASAARDDATLPETIGNHRATYAIGQGELFHGDSTAVSPTQFSEVNDWRIDARPVQAKPMDIGFGRIEPLAVALCKLRNALAIQVAPSEIVSVHRSSFCGRVYTAQTHTGIYISNGIVVSNCRCTLGYIEAEGE